MNVHGKINYRSHSANGNFLVLKPYSKEFTIIVAVAEVIPQYKNAKRINQPYFKHN